MTETHRIRIHQPHATCRPPGWQPNIRRVGRLTAGEFDRLDAIDVLGGTADALGVARSMSRTEPTEESVAAAKKYLAHCRVVGLVENLPVFVPEGAQQEPARYRMTSIGRVLFLEALSLMDRGMVDAA